jgi:hypothetical protein
LAREPTSQKCASFIWLKDAHSSFDRWIKLSIRPVRRFRNGTYDICNGAAFAKSGIFARVLRHIRLAHDADNSVAVVNDRDPSYLVLRHGTHALPK